MSLLFISLFLSGCPGSPPFLLLAFREFFILYGIKFGMFFLSDLPLCIVPIIIPHTSYIIYQSGFFCSFSDG
ncbi:hypothetical protein QBC37DRAFT_412044 [Rhypophila decipiens]|uniref:Uncharacterized protein n=1 Tax=Rhypophila decipiens TaxID=261697 RepID=A0AAN6YGA2_9PEZI|nr:hypothetical protein QBC37DRAFT_412044 [Rhypophila decipiens]